jgi:hypothetical protein
MSLGRKMLENGGSKKGSEEPDESVNARFTPGFRKAFAFNL